MNEISKFARMALATVAAKFGHLSEACQDRAAYALMPTAGLTSEVFYQLHMEEVCERLNCRPEEWDGLQPYLLFITKAEALSAIHYLLGNLPDDSVPSDVAKTVALFRYLSSDLLGGETLGITLPPETKFTSLERGKELWEKDYRVLVSEGRAEILRESWSTPLKAEDMITAAKSVNSNRKMLN